MQSGIDPIFREQISEIQKAQRLEIYRNKQVEGKIEIYSTNIYIEVSTTVATVSGY